MRIPICQSERLDRVVERNSTGIFLMVTVRNIPL
jgi:hypothetical protein